MENLTEYFTEYFTASNVIFMILAAATLLFGILTVTSTKILRSATYLFFTLFCIAGIYLCMNYDFLAAVQLSVYAGGIVVLIVFAILLIKGLGEDKEINKGQRRIMGVIAAIVGAITCIIVITKFGFLPDFAAAAEKVEAVNMQAIGTDLMGTGANQYLLPFEAASVLLLACIVGSIAIAQKNKEEKK